MSTKFFVTLAAVHVLKLPLSKMPPTWMNHLSDHGNNKTGLKLPCIILISSVKRH